MGKKGVKWCGAFNFIKIFIDLFKLRCLILIRLVRKPIQFLISFNKSKTNKTKIETNSPEINKQQISYNNFGFPIYRDRQNKK